MARSTRRRVLRSIGIGSVLVSGVGLASGDGGLDADVRKQLAEVRQATEQYQDVENAVEDGYLTDGHCVENPVGEGAMGVHYVNFLTFPDPAGPPVPDVDDEVDPLEPEGLVYEENKHGERTLVAVEYVSSEPFELFGHDSHPGPGPFYSLHAWIWRGNPDGMFANFNPKVRCPPHEEE